MLLVSLGGLGLVLVEFQYDYQDRDGTWISIKPNERYALLAKTNAHWWQVRCRPDSKPFYIPAKYVRELPPAIPSPLDFVTPPPKASALPPPLPVLVVPPSSASLKGLDRAEDSKPGDEVTIRLRPSGAGHRRNENRLSTFGVPLEHPDPLLSLQTLPWTSNAASETPSAGKRSGVLGRPLEDKPRVPSFSPADPLPAPRPHLPIAVETPVVPLLENRQVEEKKQEEQEEEKEQPEVEEQPVVEEQPEVEEQETGVRQRRGGGSEDGHHIYESIQDLNLDLDALRGETKGTLGKVVFITPSTSTSDTPPAQDGTPPPTNPIHAPLDSSHSPGPLSPASPLDMQGGWQGVWEQFVDSSGRPYYYNPSSRSTSWAPPPPLSPSSPTSHPRTETDGPPPLPEEDYPVDEESETQVLHTQTHTHTHTRTHSELMSESKPLSPPPSLSPPSLLLHLPPFLPPFSFLPSSQSHQLEKAGVLNKTKVLDSGKRIRKNWAPSWTVLHGGILTFHRDPKTSTTSSSSKTSQIVPEYTVDLKGSSLSWAHKEKSSKKNVLELKTRQGCEYLLQYDTDSIIWDWHNVVLEAIQQLVKHLLVFLFTPCLHPVYILFTSCSHPVHILFTSWESDHGRVRVKLRRFLQRRPTLQSVKEKGYIRDNVFGCHLDTLCHRENTKVPKFLEKCIRAVEKRGLDVDGIYRVSGNLAVIQKLRHKADHEECLDLDDGQWEEIHVVTGALKLFLRELPEPLFPFASFHKFIAAIQEPDYSQKVSFMKDLIGCLPLPNHDTMATLFQHLLKVIKHGEFNRMSVPSVSIVFGPTLLRPQTETAHLFTVNMVFQTRIVELVLNEFYTLFPSRQEPGRPS
ncbi:unnamed protein product [Merluccius merluccius]